MLYFVISNLYTYYDLLTKNTNNNMAWLGSNHIKDNITTMVLKRHYYRFWFVGDTIKQ